MISTLLARKKRQCAQVLRQLNEMHAQQQRLQSVCDDAQAQNDAYAKWRIEQEVHLYQEAQQKGLNKGALKRFNQQLAQLSSQDAHFKKAVLSAEQKCLQHIAQLTRQQKNYQEAARQVQKYQLVNDKMIQQQQRQAQLAADNALDEFKGKQPW